MRLVECRNLCVRAIKRFLQPIDQRFELGFRYRTHRLPLPDDGGILGQAQQTSKGIQLRHILEYRIRRDGAI